MISLFLNTSSNYLNIGLLKDNVLINEVYKKLDKDLSKETLFLIKQLLEKENIDKNQIEEVICVKGPGSFTGLRVGTTIAKTFTHFLDKKLYSVSSLEVMATSVKSDIIVPIIDARRGYVYAAIYNKNYERLMEESYIKLDKLKEIVNSFEGEKIYVSNDEFDFPVTKMKPDLNNLFNYNFKKEENSITFTPNYLKKPEAEEKLNDSKGN